MLVGYARVSTVDQDTALQLDALAIAGVKRVHQDKGSGVGPRPQLQAAIASLKPGDTFIVWKLDRIARSLADLLGIIARVKAAGASIKSLTEPIDTSTSIGNFTVQILGAVAELERNIIRERSMAGQRAAADRGKKIGRSRSLPPEKERRIVDLYGTGRYTLHDLAVRFKVHPSTVKRAVYRVNKPGHSSLR